MPYLRPCYPKKKSKLNNGCTLTRVIKLHTQAKIIITQISLKRKIIIYILSNIVQQQQMPWWGINHIISICPYIVITLFVLVTSMNYHNV